MCPVCAKTGAGWLEQPAKRRFARSRDQRVNVFRVGPAGGGKLSPGDDESPRGGRPGGKVFAATRVEVKLGSVALEAELENVAAGQTRRAASLAVELGEVHVETVGQWQRGPGKLCLHPGQRGG